MNKSDSGTAPVNVHEFERLALERLPEHAREYLESGSADEITLRRNRAAFDEILLEPRVLVDVSRIDTRCELFGRQMHLPLLVAPTAYHDLYHPDGECETARGCSAAAVTLAVSTLSSRTVEDIAPLATAGWWFQLYTQRDESVTMELVRRAESAGAEAICITVDTPVLGARDRETRIVFPPGEGFRAVMIEGASDATGPLLEPDSIYHRLLNPELTWQHVVRIRAATGLPVLLKGVLTAADAHTAVEEGIDGLIVSNHGGRNLDTAPATIEALPRVMEAVSGRVPVLLDGGVRRGTDVLKALALGAKAVLIGRPPIWGLAVAGAAGVQRVLDMLRIELQAAMALSGVTSLDRIGPHVLWQPPNH